MNILPRITTIILIVALLISCKRNDKTIEQDVAMAIHPFAPDCTLAVKNGVVYLTGLVANEKNLSAADSAAASVSGVVRVENSLRAKTTIAGQRSGLENRADSTTGEKK